MMAGKLENMGEFDDFRDVGDFGSGFEPDAYGGVGVEMTDLPATSHAHSDSMSSRQLANDGVDPHDWPEDESMLLSQGGAQQRQPGLLQLGMAHAHRERSCVYLLLLLGAWLLVGVVTALSKSVTAAFPRTPQNQEVRSVPLLHLTPSPWVVGGGAQVSSGGDLMQHITQSAANSSFPTQDGGAVGYGQWLRAADGAESEALSGVIEGSMEPGTWRFYKYRLGLYNVSLPGEFHLRVPVLSDMLDANASTAACAGGRPGHVHAIALARVGQSPSLWSHDSSSCNGCDKGHLDSENRCALICGAQQWVYIGIFAPLPDPSLDLSSAYERTSPKGKGFGQGLAQKVVPGALSISAEPIVSGQSKVPANEGGADGGGGLGKTIQGTGAELKNVSFKFRVAVTGRTFAHVLDLPHCGFAQEGYSAKMLDFVFLPALFFGLPLLALVFGCAVIRSWNLHTGSTADVLDKLVAGAPRKPLRYQRCGSRKGT